MWNNKHFFSALLTVIFVLVVSGCGSEEKVIDNTKSGWTLVVAHGGQSPVISKYNIPSNEVESAQAFADANGEALAGPVEAIIEFRGYFYLIIPSKFLIEVVDIESFKREAAFDFSADSLVPGDICFPNATDAYVCHPNASKVSLIDIHYFEKARTIDVGKNPVSTACKDSLVYTANRGDNTISVIDTRIHKVVNSIQTPPEAVSLGITPDGTSLILVAAGNGKFNDGEKSPAATVFYNIQTLEKEVFLEIESSGMAAVDVLPRDLIVSPSRWAFIVNKDLLVRISTRFRNKVVFVNRLNYTSGLFNFRRLEFVLLKDENGTQALTVNNQETGGEKASYPLPAGTTAVYPL